MPRKYTATFKNVTVTAAQDLVTLLGGAGKMNRCYRAWLFFNTNTLPTAQGLRLNIKAFTATLTAGTGGTAPTPRPLDPSDTASTTTARVNDTTPATTSGAFTDRYPLGGHLYGGWNWHMPDSGIWFGPTQGVIFELLAAPAASLELSGGLEYEEIG